MYTYGWFMLMFGRNQCNSVKQLSFIYIYEGDIYIYTHIYIWPETHRSSSEARLKECKPCTHSDHYQQPYSWTIAIKLLTKSPPPWAGTESFTGHEPTLSTSTWQSNKIYFYFIFMYSSLQHPELYESIQHRCTEAKFLASPGLQHLFYTCGGGCICI